MNRKTLLWLLVGCLACGAWLAAPSRGEALRVGYRAGNLKFTAPLADADGQYLGLAKPGGFTRKDVKAPYVLVEVLNANCPHCLEQAPAMNRLFALVRNSELKDRLKFIGVVSNSLPAVKRWKSECRVNFPLVADPDWDIADALKITGTPTTVVLDRDGKVVYLEDGAFSNAARVFKVLKSRLK